MIGDLSFFLILCIALFVFQRLSEGIKAQMKLETVNLWWLYSSQVCNPPWQQREAGYRSTGTWCRVGTLTRKAQKADQEMMALGVPVRE